MRRGSLDYVRDVFAKAGTNRVVVDYINVKWLEDSDAVITNEDPMLRGITCGWLQMRDAASPPSRNGRGGAPRLPRLSPPPHPHRPVSGSRPATRP